MTKERAKIFPGKAFLKWAGGKRQLIEALQKALPKDFLQQKDVTYVEPFVGGGAFFFWMMQRFPNIKQAVINDINEDLVKAFRTVKDSPLPLIDALTRYQDRYLPLNEQDRKDFYLSIRASFNQKTADDIENSAMLVFLNRTCFNGLYRVNSKGQFNVPHGRYEHPKICDADTLLADSEILQRTTILHGDFAQTAEYGDSHTFYYLDPPYKPVSKTSSFTAYAKEDFDDDDQRRLFDFCESISERGGKFIMSNSDVKSYNGDTFFDDLYARYHIRRVKATRMINSVASRRGQLTELMITNFDTLTGDLPF